MIPLYDIIVFLFLGVFFPAGDLVVVVVVVVAAAVVAVVAVVVVAAAAAAVVAMFPSSWDLELLDFRVFDREAAKK